MSFSYKPLWKLLIDYDMSKKDLMKATDISKSTMDKMGRGEQVSMEIDFSIILNVKLKMLFSIVAIRRIDKWNKRILIIFIYIVAMQ